ncbi:MAG: divalent-cation tolerance protein CutA [Hyphomicrobiales bacterium]|nr:divalent-cation tolerance protein CutA [Hyphomicrobiales bacterium]
MTTTNDDRPAAPVRQTQGEPAEPSSHGTNAVLVYTTFPTLSDAKKAAHVLVKARLAACVNLIEQMSAIYVWEGSVEEDSEIGMMIKTTRGRSEEVLEEIKRLHPFSKPARLVLPVVGGGADFLGWIETQCQHRWPHSRQG